MKRAPNQPETISVTIYAGIYMKTYVVPDAFTVLPQHEHQHDHITLLISGTIKARCGNDVLGEFTGPAILKIGARTLHRFVTLTPNVCLACIHNADHLENGEVAIHAEHNLPLED